MDYLHHIAFNIIFLPLSHTIYVDKIPFIENVNKTPHLYISVSFSWGLLNN